ncbi:MAG: D-alanyl-D-alanine carboxypeptidase/D-alanyl-D-alanine-endopeptidase [Parachlamydiales bacterium]|nr:D-alanyl-D-alanine carboxypeptidase/D-alanyl-D-alanine-endopeptidase [Parachlamydiales bacterium]
MKRILILFFATIVSPMFSNNYKVDHGIISVYAIDTTNNQILIDQNSDLSLIPASCMKVVTTGAALEVLGPDYCFKTAIEYDGYIDSDKTLHGNLYIRGGGDPCLGSDRFTSWDNQLQLWSKSIQNFGINKITGTVIGDATLWESSLAVSSWLWEDLGNYYGAGACALSFHENYYNVFFKPSTTVGQNAIISKTVPPLFDVIHKNEIKIGPENSGDQAWIFGCEYNLVQFMRGTIPLNSKEFSIKGAILDPASYTAHILKHQLNENGIQVLDQVQISSERHLINTTESPPLNEIIYWTNHNSINLYAEHLLKQLGQEVYQEGSTKSGLQAVTNFWKDKGVDMSGFNMADGSGLSRKNLTTTKQLVKMLSILKKSENFPIFLRSLVQKENNLRIKGGTMSGIKAIVGFYDHIAFAILINNCLNYKSVNQTLELILNELKPKQSNF